MILHEKNWRYLLKSAKLGHLSHAYLFTGPAKLGKRKTAIEFVKFLFCSAKSIKNRPCQSCSFCLNVQKEKFPDLFIIEPYNKEIKISQIRELNQALSLRPYSAPMKVAIINDAHFMNSEAQNSLLKTLEEPRGRTILILITQFPDLLLKTILSRLEVIKFHPLPPLKIEEYLKKLGASSELAKKLSVLSFGRPMLALDFLKNPDEIKKQEKIFLEIKKLVETDFSYRFRYIKRTKDRDNLEQVLELWLRYFRNLLLKRVRKIDALSDFSSLHTKYSVADLKRIINFIQDIFFLISYTNINVKLALEVLMLEI